MLPVKSRISFQILHSRSLLTFAATENGTLSYELLLRYLILCVRCGHDAEVFDVYEIMRGSFPCLDTGAFSLFIKALSRTARWREALNLLHELKKVSSFFEQKLKIRKHTFEVLFSIRAAQSLIYLKTYLFVLAFSSS